MIKKGDVSFTAKGTQVYKGVMNFTALHEWINIHSETFVKGGGFLTDVESGRLSDADIRPWLSDKFPQMVKASHQDVCFRKQGLCAIYLTNAAELDQPTRAMLEKISNEYGPHTFPAFHWSWMQIDKEPNFASV